MAISLVQQKSGQITGAGGDLTVTFDSSTTSGNAIVCNISGWDTGANPGPTITCADNKGNTYTANSAGLQATSGAGIVHQFYCVNISGGSSHQVTMGTSGAVTLEYKSLEILELSGVETSSPIDGTPIGRVLGFSGSHATNSITTTADASIVIFAATEDGGMTATLNNSYIETEDAATGQPLHAGYLIKSPAGSTNVTFSWSSSAASASVGLALKAGSAPAPATPKSLAATGVG